MPETHGGEGPARRQSRKEADVVRLVAERLESGLYRHRPAKFVMELPGRKVKAERNRDDA